LPERPTAWSCIRPRPALQCEHMFVAARSAHLTRG